MPTHLADSPNILVTRFFVKSQIFVQPKPNIVAVKAVSELVQVQKVLLESAGDGGLKVGQFVVKISSPQIVKKSVGVSIPCRSHLVRSAR